MHVGSVGIRAKFPELSFFLKECSSFNMEKEEINSDRCIQIVKLLWYHYVLPGDPSTPTLIAVVQKSKAMQSTYQQVKWQWKHGNIHNGNSVVLQEKWKDEFVGKRMELESPKLDRQIPFVYSHVWIIVSYFHICVLMGKQMWVEVMELEREAWEKK